MKAILRLLRPKHWIKNLFIFVPTFFAGSLFQDSKLDQLIYGFLLFSMLASSIYILNDINDVADDRIHPKKRLRPIASGAVKTSTAWIIMGIMVLVSLSSALLLNSFFFYLLLGYFILNVGYSLGLKNIPILDLFIVSFGFLLRVYCGGILGDVEISHWLSIMILLLALFLIIAKRRDDLVIRGETGEIVRKSSQAYNLEFINSCITLLSAVVIVAYIMYTVSPEVIKRFNSNYLFATTIFVIAGIMRYLQITFVEQNSGSPTTILFRDKFILITIIGWITSFYVIIYAS